LKADWLEYSFGTRAADPSFPFTLAKQIHSDIVHVVKDGDSQAKLRGDAFVTATPGVTVAVATADCLPALLADPENRVVAAIHAGWRGTLKRVTEKTVGLMHARFGTNPAKLWAALGPSIQVCCYEVGPEVIDEFHSQFPYAAELFEKQDPENPALTRIPRQTLFASIGSQNAIMRALDSEHAYLNVEEANVRQLLDVGVPRTRILRGSPCTGCRTDLYNSYRKQGPKSGRQVSAIQIGRALDDLSGHP
jgi:YfiH family protein